MNNLKDAIAYKNYMEYEDIDGDLGYTISTFWPLPVEIFRDGDWSYCANLLQLLEDVYQRALDHVNVIKATTDVRISARAGTFLNRMVLLRIEVNESGNVIVGDV